MGFKHFKRCTGLLTRRTEGSTLETHHFSCQHKCADEPYKLVKAARLAATAQRNTEDNYHLQDWYPVDPVFLNTPIFMVGKQLCSRAHSSRHCWQYLVHSSTS